MKHAWLAVILSLFLATTLLTGCGNEGENQDIFDSHCDAVPGWIYERPDMDIDSFIRDLRVIVRDGETSEDTEADTGGYRKLPYEREKVADIAVLMYPILSIPHYVLVSVEIHAHAVTYTFRETDADDLSEAREITVKIERTYYIEEIRQRSITAMQEDDWQNIGGDTIYKETKTKSCWYQWIPYEWETDRTDGYASVGIFAPRGALSSPTELFETISYQAAVITEESPS